MQLPIPPPRLNGACHYTLKQCNGSYIDHDATCPPKPKPDPTPEPTADPDPPPTPRVDPPPTPAPTPKPGDNDGGDKDDCLFDFKSEHRHNSTNVCHLDHPDCDASKYSDETGTVWGSTGGDTHGYISVDGCKTRCSYDPNSQHRHDSTNVCHLNHPTCALGKYSDETGTVWGSTGGDTHGYISVAGCGTRPCSSGYQRLTAPLPIIYFVYTSATPELMTHEELNEYYKSGRTASANLGIWEEQDDNPGCYKAVEDTGTTINLFQIVVDGVTYLVREGVKIVSGGVEYIVRNGAFALEVAADHVLSAAETAAKATAEAAITALEATDNLLKRTLCSAIGGGVSIIAVGLGVHFSAKTATVAIIAAAVGGTTLGTATALGVVVGLAIHAYCTDGFTSNPYNDSVSAPEAPSGLSASGGAGEIAVSWSASATVPAAGFGYRVQWKLTTQAWGDAAAGSEDLDHGSDLATSHTITGLVNGSAYDVRVAAFNANGVSDWITGQTTPAKPKPSLTFDSVSCASSGSGWVISVTWSKTPESLKPDIWASEAKNRGHRGRQTAVAGTSTTFDVPNAGWYQVGMQAKIAGNKKVGDYEPVRCR